MFRESVALAVVVIALSAAAPASAQSREELSRLMVEAYDHMEAGARLIKRAKLAEGKARYGKACAAYAKVLGGLKGLAGKVPVARLRVTAQVCHYNTACARAQRGEKKLALDAFARALASGYDDFRRIEKDGSLNPIRKEPRYAQLLERVKNKLARAVQRAGAMTLSSKPLFAYDFQAKTLAGKQLKLKDLRGKVVIVDYWGTWCGPCKMEIPHFVALKKEFGARLEVVGMTWEHGKSDPKTVKMVKAFAKVLKINYPLIMLSKQADLAKVPNLRAFPTTLFIDKQGRVRAREVGYRDRASIRKLVAALDAEGRQKGTGEKKAPAKKFH